MAQEAQVIAMPKRDDDEPGEITPWGALGFATERDMLLDDLRTIDARLKSPTTTATAVAALSKRKFEIFELLKSLDADDDPDDILDDSEDEAWDASGD